MLKGIPCILSPELLKTLMEMGHGNELVFADGNFPPADYGRHLVRLDGHGIPSLLEAILTFFPLDSFVEKPVTLMEVSPESGVEVPIWYEYRKIGVVME
jgi:L-fucose mutarotase